MAFVKFCVIYCILLSTAFASQEFSELQKSKIRNPKKKEPKKVKVVGGEPISISEVPYQASLSAPSRHTCGAVVIDRTWAVTAAHCVVGRLRGFQLRTGSTDLNRGGILTPVSRVIIHNGYSVRTQNNDIALLHTSRPITNAQPIQLASREPSSGDVGLVTGWGVIREGSSAASPTLLQANVPIVQREACRRMYQGAITDRMICAGRSEGGKDACQGDSGGPLAVHNQLAGIVSWGRGCGRPAAPGVYTNVASPGIRSWINQYLSVASG